MKRTAQTLSLFDLMQMYPTEKEVIRHMERIQWGNVPCCTRGGSTDKITPQKKISEYWCGYCHQYFNVKTGTPLEHNRIRDQRVWFYASYLLMAFHKGISTMQLSKELSISCKAAWYMPHRLRFTCGKKMQALRGTVEVDEIYFGRKEDSKHAVTGLRERGARAKALPIEKADKETLHGVARSHVMPGSTIYTDDNLSYYGVAHRHCTVNHSAKKYVNNMTHTNGIEESVWTMLKHGFNGTYHSWSKKYCRAYVNKFTFRLNESNVERDTQDRLDDPFRSMAEKTITCEELTA